MAVAPYPTAKDIKPDRAYDSHYRAAYPEGVYLKPGSPKHEKLKAEIFSRAVEASNWLGQRHYIWSSIDDMLQAYIPVDEYEKARLEKDSRLPVSIVVPEAYAVLDTFMAYLVAVFGQEPLFSYDPVGPEDAIGTVLLEGVVQQQLVRGKGLLRLATHFRDAVAYGLGVMALPWDVRLGRRSRVVPDGIVDPTLGYVPTGFRKVADEAVLFEGTLLEPIDPRLYLPDPAVDLAEVQAGEYVGWIERTTYLTLRRQEAAPDSPYFNVRYLEDLDATSVIYSGSKDAASGTAMMSDTADGTSLATQRVDVIHMYVDLIPADWDLGTGKEPEKWRFSLAGDCVLIAAMPMDLYHEMFPVVVAAPGTDGHGGTPLSKLELTYGYLKYLNFLLNSRMVNIMEMNNRFLVNPAEIEIGDIEAGSPIIRARRSAWNTRSLADSFQQIKMQDVTGNNMVDLGAVRELMRHGTGAVDALQGIQRTRGERVTGKEFSETRAAAMGRMHFFAKIIAQQSLLDAAYIFAAHTQQFMSEETYLRTTGRLEDVLRQEYGYEVGEPYVQVSPFDLDVVYDVRPHTGEFPGGDATDWVTVLSIMMKNPEVLQTFDLTRLYTHVLRKLGATNIHEFKKKAPLISGAVVAPVGEVQAEAAKGNLVAVGGGRE